MSAQIGLQYVVMLLAMIWLLAVYKVFVLDDGGTSFEYQRREIAVLPPSVSHISHLAPTVSKRTSSAKSVTSSKTTIAFQKKPSETGPILLTTKNSMSRHLPLASEWSEIHIHERKGDLLPTTLEKIPTINQPAPNFAVDTAVDTNNNGDVIWDNTSDLHWPPVQPDGSISVADGKDIMPIINLEVPRFWYPSKEENWNTVGSKVNGEETIFLMIASYRDFQCRETITSAFARADHPERLFIGAVDQTVPGDTGCLDIEIPCSVDATQPICQYRDQISIFHMDAQMATGPVTARHVGDRMYRGQYFVMQMDAHCLFVRHWDRLIIDQWKSTHNEMAVLR
jgi:hypothetical protein